MTIQIEGDIKTKDKEEPSYDRATKASTLRKANKEPDQNAQS